MENRILVSEIEDGLKEIVVAGRVMATRRMKNYFFCDIKDVSGSIQLIVSTLSEIILPAVGDIVLVEGSAVRTKAGQLSVEGSSVKVLSPGSMDVINAIKSNATKGADVRGQRSLSLMVNEDLQKMVKARSLFISEIRDYFRAGSFLEIDTPVMSYSRFAGTADVFETKSRTLDRSLYLRGTLEDYLKQLVVAGFEKVFQIGDCFRNESPALIEFTMLEATWAYATSEQMLEFIQDLIKKICDTMPDELVDVNAKNDLSKKIDVVTFWGTLESDFGVDIRKIDYNAVLELAKKKGYVCPESMQSEYELAKFGYEIIKRNLAHNYKVPTFVGRFPACISPLAKEMVDGSGEADRGYGFFRGQRLFEVVEEASSYQEQLNKFDAQDSRANGRGYSFKHDDLLTSLGYGCPPMAGLGFNINRVLAVLLNVDRTSDITAFPLTSAALPL